jgi:hypothetical protein
MKSEYPEPGKNNLLHNSGGPRSRVRSELVSSDLLKSTGTGSIVKFCFASVLPEVQDCYEWLDGLSRQAGYTGIRDADTKIPRPDRSCCIGPLMGIYPVNRRLDSPDSLEELIRDALILARCNTTGYYPDASPVFTRSRLDRYIELFTFNMERFYHGDEPQVPE